MHVTMQTDVLGHVSGWRLARRWGKGYPDLIVLLWVAVMDDQPAYPQTSGFRPEANGQHSTTRHRLSLPTRRADNTHRGAALH